MTIEMFCKSKTFLNRNEIILDRLTIFFIYFIIKDYNISYDIINEKWNCECEFYSCWSKQKRLCSHIRSCILYINNDIELKKHILKIKG